MILSLLALGCSGSTGPTEQPPVDAITLIYTNNVDGEIEPCG